MTSFLEEELVSLQNRIHLINMKLGWYDAPRTPGDEIALLHSEISELFECIRKGHWETSLEGEDFKPVGAPTECADIMIRLLDFCTRYKINLAAEVETKIEYNKSRTHRHGGKAL